MTLEQIREIAIDSSVSYFDYLDKNEKGIQIVDVFELTYLRQSSRGCIIRLRLSSKLRDLDSITFKLLTNNRTYATDQVNVLEYDSDKNSMLVKIEDADSVTDFMSLKYRDIKVIADLKFLVKRVKDWYEKNGSKIKLPALVSALNGEGSKLNDKSPELKFLAGLEPSENQKQSIRNILNKPFSYVWGAPGTGKTQFVLAYAVLHYIRNGQRVAILAPTNNALEQVLRGVIKMTDTAGIERNKIIRLGSPSKKFAEEFIELCEDAGVVRELGEVERQIQLLNRVIEFKTKNNPVFSGNLNLLLLGDEVQPAQKDLPVDNDQSNNLLDDFINDSMDELPYNLHFLLEEYKNDSVDTLKVKLQSHISSQSKLAHSSTVERLKNVNVIACTLDYYIGNLAKLDVQHIFLDEAGYANMIKALTLFQDDTPVSFLGDHKQLPPVCELNDISIEKEKEFQNVFLWAQSAVYIDTLFSQSRDDILRQYITNTATDAGYISKTMLNVTYRFGANLATILGKYIYLANFSSVNPDGNTKILYINAPKREEAKSRISITEVMTLKNLVSFLRWQNSNDYVILTPYVKQVKLLGKYLPQERNDMKILTVHGSQGREWDTVLLSVVDTHDKWFVDSANNRAKGLNLLNTAVSRAKKQLVIVCDTHYWKAQRGQLLTDLINAGEELTV
ncbi:MAG: AAA family ATPase [Tannerella sp.]|jgi:hypothetical protein|nr:AAA family ATPase [Tannerella sp.]